MFKLNRLVKQAFAGMMALGVAGCADTPPRPSNPSAVMPPPNAFVTLQGPEGAASCQVNGQWGRISGGGSSMVWVRDDTSMLGKTVGPDGIPRHFLILRANGLTGAYTEIHDSRGGTQMTPASQRLENMFLGQEQKTAKLCAWATGAVMAFGLRQGETRTLQEPVAGIGAERVDVTYAAPQPEPPDMRALLQKLKENFLPSYRR